MKRLILTVLASLTLLSSLEAALPPLYQTSTEIKAIMMDPQLGQKLQSGEVITKIEKTAKGYEIFTNEHRLQVDVDYQPAERPGPTPYTLEFKDLQPLSAQ